jgi:hypothetical protein
MKTRLLVAILGLLFSQEVFADYAFPYMPTAKQLYELIDDGKVLGTHASSSTTGVYSVTIVLHPKYGLVTCFGESGSGYHHCVSSFKEELIK